MSILQILAHGPNVYSNKLTDNPTEQLINMVFPNAPSQRKSIKNDIRVDRARLARSERGPRNRQNGIRPEGNRERRRRQRSPTEEVVTRAVRTTNRAPRMTASANSCRVVHREMFHTVIGLGDTATGFSVRQPINPGNTAMFPWLSRVAQNYESYRFKALSFEFITTAPTTVAGSVTMAVDYDPTDPAPNDGNAVRALNAFIGAQTAPIYTPKVTVHCRNANLNKRKTYFVSNSPGPDIATGPQPVSVQIGSRDRTADTGQFITAVVAPAENVGLLFVDYDIELLTPHYEKPTGDALTVAIPYPDASSPPGPQVTQPNHLTDIDNLYNVAEEPSFPFTDYDSVGVSSVVSGKWAGKSNSDNTTFAADGMSLGYGTASSYSASGSPEQFIQFSQPGFYLFNCTTWTFPATATTADDALSVPFFVNYDDNDNKNYCLKNSVGATFFGNATINGISLAQVGSAMVIAVEHPLSRMFLRQVTEYNRVVAPLSKHFTHGIEWSLVRIGGLDAPVAAAIAGLGTYALITVPYLIMGLRRQDTPTPSPLIDRALSIRRRERTSPSGLLKESVDEPTSFETCIEDIEELPRKLLLLNDPSRARKPTRSVQPLSHPVA